MTSMLQKTCCLRARESLIHHHIFTLLIARAHSVVLIISFISSSLVLPKKELLLFTIKMRLHRPMR